MRALRSLDCKFLVCTLVVGAMGLMGNHLIYALPLPANHTITTKLTDTLKSITSNVSTSIQNDIDKVISDTMDITINNVMSQLSNATILGNNDASPSHPKNPSSIDLSDVSLPVSNEFASLDK
jgi:proline dehydrogenase